MKAEELMRFDWVRLVDDNTPRQVDWIRSGEVGLLWNKTVTPPYLEPIPLTPEILEKNGFNYDEDRKVYLMGVIFQVKPEKYGLFSFEICGCPYPLNTVHELQHALRLCGIEKEIELTSKEEEDEI